jgi:hypothetical protein
MIPTASSNPSASPAPSPVAKRLDRTSCVNYYHALASVAGGCATRHPELVKSILALYDNASSDSDFAHAFDDHTEDVIFEDPLSNVTGLHHYKAQFTYLRKNFLDIYPIELHVTATEDRIYFDSQMRYVQSNWLEFNIRQITVIRVNAIGKVIAHEDIWSLTERLRSLPLIGFFYNKGKSLFGYLSSKWFATRLGMGNKDEKIKSSPITRRKSGHRIQSNNNAETISS